MIDDDNRLDNQRDYHRTYMRKWRVGQTEEQLAKIRTQVNKSKVLRRAKIAALIQLHKNKPCIDCGGKFPPVIMEFDHVRGEKLFNIAHWEKARLGKRNREQAILEEIAKCEVRCPTCHRLRHLYETR
jgi:hypothetical protein